jgi:hypothetical protein
VLAQYCKDKSKSQWQYADIDSHRSETPSPIKTANHIAGNVLSTSNRAKFITDPPTKGQLKRLPLVFYHFFRGIFLKFRSFLGITPREYGSIDFYDLSVKRHVFIPRGDLGDILLSLFCGELFPQSPLYWAGNSDFKLNVEANNF